MNLKPFTKFAMGVALLLPALSGNAQDIGYATESSIDGEVAGNARGIIAVNQAAGDSNLQVNEAAVAIGDQAASASAGISQHLHHYSGNLPDVAVARIGQHAFGNAVGIIAVNQASGVANAQSNSVVVAMGINGEVGDEVLSAALPDVAGLVHAGVSGGVREVGVDDTAFRNARGLVQLNQTAGAGNSSSNNFALRIVAEQ